MAKPSPSFPGRRRFLQGNNKKEKKGKPNSEKPSKNLPKQTSQFCHVHFRKRCCTPSCAATKPHSFLLHSLLTLLFLTTTTKSLLVESQKKNGQQKTKIPCTTTDLQVGYESTDSSG
jgi:hypothetical protein